MAEPSIGVDTVSACVRVRDVVVDLDHPDIPFLEGPPVNIVTDEEMNGTSFKTADGGSVTLKRGRLRMGPGSPLQAWVVGGGLKVQMTLARRGGTEGPNVLPVRGAEGIGRRIRGIERLYRERGLTIDLEAGRLLRADLFKDVALPLRLHEYGHALDACGVWPMTPTDSKELLGSGRRLTTSYARYNTDRALIVYDKPGELGLVDGAPETGRGCVARVEDRYRTERSMEQLGVATVADLAEHWETVCLAFDSSVQDYFGVPPTGPLPDLGRRMSDDEILEHFKRAQSQEAYAIDDLLVLLGIESWASNHGGIEALRRFLGQHGYTPRQIRRRLDSRIGHVRTGEGPTCGELKASLAAAIAGPAYGWPEFTEPAGGEG